MKRPPKLLTELSVAKEKPASIREEIADLRFPGFYLIIQPNCAKSFALRYRYGGRPRKLTLGQWPRTSLAKAKKRAGDALEALEQGNDPAATFRPAQSEVPHRGDRDAFGNVVHAFIEKHARPHNRSWKETARLLGVRPDTRTPERLVDISGGIAARWAERDIGKIRRRDIIDAVEAIEHGTLANRTFSALRKLFNWCLARDIISFSPCAGVKPPHAEESRDRVLSDAEVRAVWTAAEANGYPYGSLVQLLLLTAQRRAEVAGMTEQEIDAARQSWAIRRERTKNKLPHSVPLTAAALDIIAKLPRIAGDGFLFTGSGRSAFSGFSRAKRNLDKAVLIELKRHDDAATLKPWTLHDLRRTAATRMQEIGVLPHVVEAVLNHISGHKGGVAGVYNRAEYERQKRKALERWARHLNRIVTGKISNVVPFLGAG